MSPAADDVVMNEVRDGLVQISFTVIARLGPIAADHDLSLTQLRLLGILRDREPKMAELARYLGLEPSSASGLIERAVQRGLVQRAVSRDDARIVRVSLTAKGRRLLSELGEQIDDLIAPMTRSLTPAEQKRLGTLLQRVLER